MRAPRYNMGQAHQTAHIELVFDAVLGDKEKHHAEADGRHPAAEGTLLADCEQNRVDSAPFLRILIAESYSQSFGFTSALNQSISETYTAQCDPGGEYTRRALYQFSTSTAESCIQNGDCTGQTFTAQYICVGDAPSGYAGPACVPNYCANPLCTVCTYD